MTQKKQTAMNLFYDSSIVGLRQLIDTADKSLGVHNIVIDYDGEVIIDPEKKYASVGLNRYKFCTKMNRSVLKSGQGIKALLEKLVAGYSGTGNGAELFRMMKRAA
jgi:hypothetical protein